MSSTCCCIENSEQAPHIHVEVFIGGAKAILGADEGCEMEHAVKGRAVGEERWGIADRPFDQPDSGRNVIPTTSGKVIKHYDFVGSSELFEEVRANEAGAAGDECSGHGIGW